VFLTSVSRFRSQPFGNTGGQHNTLRPSCHDANWIDLQHAESKARNTNAFPAHSMTWGPALP